MLKAVASNVSAAAMAAAFGAGVDGNITISSGTTTLPRNTAYNNVIINGTGKLYTSGWILYANVLDISAAASGAIYNIQGNAYTGGNNASGATGGGTAGQGALSTTVPTSTFGNLGVTGTTGVGGNATNVGNIPYLIGGAGGASGAGGAGVPNAGGAAGTVTTSPTFSGGFDFITPPGSFVYPAVVGAGTNMWTCAGAGANGAGVGRAAPLVASGRTARQS